MDNDFATGYALGSDSGEKSGNGNGMWGDGGWIFLILIFALFGWGGNGNGFGNNGSGGGGVVPTLGGIATRSDIMDGFALNDLQRGVSSIQQGVCDSTYALNNAITGGFNSTNMGMMQGFNGVDRSVCNLQSQLQDCCCQTQNAIQNVRYDMATQACDTRNTIQNTTRDIIDNANANSRAILDFLTQDKIASLQAENQSLKFAASQASQNTFIAANQEAQTAELIRRCCPSPVPAYAVPAPYPYGGCNTGCGCGC